MIEKKERIDLRSKAQTIKPTVMVGKEGFAESVLNQIDEELFNHELIKIAMLETAPTLTEFDLAEIAVKLNAEVVTTIGRKIVLFRHSEKKGIKHVLDADAQIAQQPSKRKQISKTKRPKHTKK